MEMVSVLREFSVLACELRTAHVNIMQLPQSAAAVKAAVESSAMYRKVATEGKTNRIAYIYSVPTSWDGTTEC